MEANDKTIKRSRVLFILCGYLFILGIIWIGMNKLFFSNADPSGLVKEYETLLKEDPDNAGFHIKLGDIYLEMNEQIPGKGYLQKAKSQYQKAVELYPENIQYHYSLASVLTLLKDKGALDEYRAILELDPYEVQANYEVALNDISQGNYDAAIYHLEKCLVREPSSSDVYFAIGKIFEKQRKWDEAKKMYEMALKYDPSIKDARNRLNNLLQGK